MLALLGVRIWVAFTCHFNGLCLFLGENLGVKIGEPLPTLAVRKLGATLEIIMLLFEHVKIAEASSSIPDDSSNKYDITILSTVDLR